MFNLTVDFAFLLREDAAASTASLFSVVITFIIASRCIINHESHLVDVQLAILNFYVPWWWFGTTAALLSSGNIWPVQDDLSGKSAPTGCLWSL
jgi:hypothetical protein